MSGNSESSHTLFCASVEKEIEFNKLPKHSIDKISSYRNKTVFFVEYAKMVVYAVIGKKAAEDIWNNYTNKTGYSHVLFELYWIATVINPELSWSLRTARTVHGETAPHPIEKEQESENATSDTLRDRLPLIEKFLRDNVVGQNEGLEVVLDVLYRTAAGLNDSNRPRAVVLFTGPSGSGKTHMAKCLSAALFKESPRPDDIVTPPNFFRIDCTLYQHHHEISNLIGSPQGYIGSDLGSPLPAFLKANQDGCVILIDEAEKAHPALHKIFMGLFDYGRIKDNKQCEVEAHNAIFIMTSNAGSSEASGELGKLEKPFGFVTSSVDPCKITKKSYEDALNKLFPPELRGRIDEMVVFNHLDEASYRKILEIEIKKIQKNLQKNKVKLRITPSAKKAILSKGVSKELGARDLSRYVREVVSKPLSKLIIKTDSKSYVCRAVDGTITIEADSDS